MSDIKDSPDNYFESPSDPWGEYETYQTIPACGLAKTVPSDSRWLTFNYTIKHLDEKPMQDGDKEALWSKDRCRVSYAKRVIKAAQEYIDKISEEQDIEEILDVEAEKKHDSVFMDIRVYLAEKKLKEEPDNVVALSVLERFGPKS